MKKILLSVMMLLTIVTLGINLPMNTPLAKAANDATTCGTSTSEPGAQNEKVPVLNSNADGFIGDEQYFIRVLELGGDKEKDNVWEPAGQEIEVTKDSAYLVDVYVINDTPGSTAKDVKATVIFPSDEDSQTKTISAIISASNTEQKKYVSSITFRSADHNIWINPIYGSTVFDPVDLKEKRVQAEDLFAFGTADSYGKDAEPEWVEKRRQEGADMSMFNAEEPGILLGKNLNGKVGYGPENIQVVRFSINVNLRRYYSWKVETSPTSRLDEAKVSFTYTNMDKEIHNDVTTHFSVNQNNAFEIIPGTMTITDKAHPNGAPLKDGVKTGYGNGYNSLLGDYAPGEQAVITCKIRPRDGADFDSDFGGYFTSDCMVGKERKSASTDLYVSDKLIAKIDVPGGAIAEEFKINVCKIVAIQSLPSAIIFLLSTICFFFLLKQIIKNKRKENR